MYCFYKVFLQNPVRIPGALRAPGTGIWQTTGNDKLLDPGPPRTRHFLTEYRLWKSYFVKIVYENVNLSIIQFYDCNGIANGNSVEDCLGICDGNAIEDQCGICDGDNSSCSGCTNEDACNYDPDAIISNNSDCQFPEYLYNCDNEWLEDDDNDGICNLLEVEGCTDEISWSFPRWF